MLQHMPELKQPFSARFCFAFRETVMSNTAMRSDAAQAGRAQAAIANTIDRMGSLFLAGLQHLYAAHTEKVQMRFAPKPICRARAIERPHPFGL